MPPLNEFQNLCLDVLREAKGNTILDGILNAPETSGTNEVISPIPTTSIPTSSATTTVTDIPSTSKSTEPIVETQQQKKEQKHRKTITSLENLIYSLLYLKEIPSVINVKKEKRSCASIVCYSIL